MKKIAKVAIVGRANVGKSTLFNRLIEKNKALISDTPGTTRDSNIDIVNWQGRSFEVIDTGGIDLELKHPDDIEKGILKQAQKNIDTADLILFLIDVKAGALLADKEIAKILKKKNNKKIILVGNKADSLKLRQAESPVYKLGFGEPFYVSAANGSGIGDLLDEILSRLSKEKTLKVAEDDNTIKIAIVGKPNVGKSSLLNSILGEERVIVTDKPHTTRESHDSFFFYKENNFTIIDTAGMIRKARINPKSLEKKSIGKSIDAIKEADVVILVTEVQKKIDTQDKKITQKILEEGKSLIIAANKWDIIENKETNDINEYKSYYYSQFPYLWWAPLIFISAKSGQRSKKILDMAIEVRKSRNITISQSQLDDFLKSKIKQHKPSRGKGLKNPYIYKIEQVKTNPPKFFIYVNDPTILHFSYIRFLQNNLREKFKISGTPIQMEVKKWVGNKNETNNRSR